VAKELAKNLVDHRRFALGANRVAELPLDRRKGGFDVAALVVVGEELIFFELTFPLERGRCGLARDWTPFYLWASVSN
jgi:hypothetical protein